MAEADILSQDEIDALMHGVDSGAVDTSAGPAPGEVRQFDFATQVRIVRGRMPTLEMINERFARLFRISLFNMLRRSPEISVAPIQMLKFTEYVHTLHVPADNDVPTDVWFTIHGANLDLGAMVAGARK